MLARLLVALSVLCAWTAAEPLSDKAIADLEEELLFAEGDARTTVAKRVIALKDARTRGALAKFLLADPPPTPELQDLVAAALLPMADASILPEVERMAKSENPALRQHGLDLLGSMRNERAADILLAALESTSNAEQLQVTIIRSLGRNGHAKATAPLKALAEKTPALADEVTIARTRIGDPEAFKPFFDFYRTQAETLATTAWDYGFRTGKPAEVQRLKKAKAGLEETLRRMTEALQGMSTQAIPTLVEYARTTRDPEIFQLLFSTLPGLIRPESAALFLPLLDSPSSELAHLAMAQMDRAGQPGLKERIDSRLLELLKDGDAYTRRLVLENAVRFGPDKGWEVLQAGLKDRSPWVRQRAAEETRKWQFRMEGKQ